MRNLFPDNTFVPPEYPSADKDLARLAIAEAPGEDEAIAGRPLVGGAGRWFESMLRHAGIDRNGLTIINCLNCRPPKNIFPTDSEARAYISREEANKSVKQCYENHVKPILTSRKWKRVDLFGDKPLKIVGKINGTIGRFRGSPIPIPECGPEPLAIATLHPAFIGRDQTMFPVVVNDLKKDLSISPEYYTPYPTIEEVRAFKYKKFALDIETRGFTKEILVVGVCAEPYTAMAIPFRGEYIAEIRRILLDAETLIGQNLIQFDLPILFERLNIEW